MSLALATEDNDDTWLYGEQEHDQEQHAHGEQDGNTDITDKPNQTLSQVYYQYLSSNPLYLTIFYFYKLLQFQDKTLEEKQNGDNANAGNEDEDDDAHFDDDHFEDNETMDADKQENGDSDSDDSEDDVKVIIGDLKSAPQTYASLNIKV